VIWKQLDVEVVPTEVLGIITIHAEMIWIAAVTTLSNLDQIATILLKLAMDTGMEGVEVEVTFLEVFMVVEVIQVGLEVLIKILIHRDRRIHHKVLHTQKAIPVTEGIHILGI